MAGTERVDLPHKSESTRLSRSLCRAALLPPPAQIPKLDTSGRQSCKDCRGKLRLKEEGIGRDGQI
jgi:hypothetical protein